MNLSKNIYLKFIYLTLIFFWSTAIFEIGTPFFIRIFGISLSNISFSLFLICLVLFAFSGYSFNKRINNRFLILIFLIILYLIYSLIGSFYSPQKNQGLKETIILFYYLFTLFLSIISLNLLDYYYKIKLFYNIGILSYITLLLMTILQFFDIAIFNENILKNNIKYFSAFSDYNIFMLSLLTSIFIILSNIKKDKSFLSFYIFNIIIIFLFGFLSGSRRSMIYLLFYILVFSKFTKIKQKKVVLALFLATLSIFIILIVFIDFNIIIKTNPEKASNAYFSKINRILSSYSGEREIYSERFDRWNKAMNVIKKFSFCQIIIGLGTRSYYSLEEFIRPGGSHDYPHNFILSAFIEGGIIKTILVLIISLYPLSFLIKKTKIKDEKKRISVLLLYSIWLIQVFISGDEFFNSKQIFLIYFMINTYLNINNKKELDEKNCINSIK